MNPMIAMAFLIAACLLAGCESFTPDTERGPDRTSAQYMRIESSVPGVSIETNNVYAGKTPLTLRIFGDAPGTFHNFGSPEFSLRALPLTTNQFVQSRVFRTGNKSAAGGPIPGLIFFNMAQPGGNGMLIDSMPDK